MYSDDHGNNWTYVEADQNTGGATAEAQIVEMPDGSLKLICVQDQDILHK